MCQKDDKLSLSSLDLLLGFFYGNRDKGRQTGRGVFGSCHVVPPQANAVQDSPNQVKPCKFKIQL